MMVQVRNQQGVICRHFLIVGRSIFVSSVMSSEINLIQYVILAVRLSSLSNFAFVVS